VSSTGIAGLTLGGGIGWLMGRCGLACDNTLAYEMATADGQLIQVTADSHPDLFGCSTAGEEILAW
jgi:FAD/FMN-containing dehydrogenase